MNIHLALLVLALISFFIAAIAVPVPRVNLIALGLAFWMLSLILKP